MFVVKTLNKPGETRSCSTTPQCPSGSSPVGGTYTEYAAFDPNHGGRYLTNCVQTCAKQ